MISACCQVVVVFTTDEDILSFGRVDEVFASLPSCGGDSVGVVGKYILIIPCHESGDAVISD